jgi:hypothetical protein
MRVAVEYWTRIGQLACLANRRNGALLRQASFSIAQLYRSNLQASGIPVPSSGN